MPRAAPLAVEAIRLLGKWARISQGHVSLSAGCSCGLGFGAVRLQDFEQEILDYLRGKHAAVIGDAADVTALLRGLGVPGVSRPKAAAMLADLERSIDSFDQQHR